MRPQRRRSNNHYHALEFARDPLKRTYGTTGVPLLGPLAAAAAAFLTYPAEPGKWLCPSRTPCRGIVLLSGPEVTLLGGQEQTAQKRNQHRHVCSLSGRQPFLARSQPVGGPKVPDPRVIEVSQRWYPFGAKIGRLRLADSN